MVFNWPFCANNCKSLQAEVNSLGALYRPLLDDILDRHRRDVLDGNEGRLYVVGSSSHFTVGRPANAAVAKDCARVGQEI